MLKTLIVDDSATFRKTFKEALCERFPFMLIEEALDATEALQKIKAFLPDVIFMDIRLPGESGLELTRRIKASHPEIAIIILTAYDLWEYREAAYDGGADAFLSKSSLNLADISALIKSLFSDNGCYELHDPGKDGCL
ncbi:MAG: response regulator transcription factor [Deltaproteobacteria bacterium]|jgi:DNA-binding NarL/FixJ family response regulator|nr:response regulator transcription factor [Deltaproteobacteria bacterium]MDL1986527.1 response regulator transcription factor [Deltaproteobacteria bacterium]MDL2122756.1 response regulator transcription factor [Deltaproteobacteria bacterium]